VAGSDEVQWWIYEGGPLDFFQGGTIPVADVMANPGHPLLDVYDGLEHFVQDVHRAEAAVRQHPLWDGRLRHPPHVVYIPARDNYCYLFKLHKNGTTFLVSDFPQAFLLREDRYPGPWTEIIVRLPANVQEVPD
jgi:hypothetical protein